MKIPSVALLTTLIISTSATLALDARAATEKVLYTFCSRQNCADGHLPEGTLIYDHGILYGTTIYGGVAGCGGFGCGTVFSVDPAAGTETVIHAFRAGSDGQWPTNAGVVDVDGFLYGTTIYGGSGTGEGCTSGCGTVYSIGLRNRSESVVYSFDEESGTGYDPEGGLVGVKGVLYGSTYYGDDEYGGTVFSFDPAAGTGSVVYNFDAGKKRDGYRPVAGVIGVKGMLYGTTIYGARRGGYPHFGGGTIFGVDPAAGTETFLHSLLPSQGARPVAALIEANGELYGTARYGGTGTCLKSPRGCGTVFSVDLKNGEVKVLHDFQGNGIDGKYPDGSLTYVKGRLYGTTTQGGVSGLGAIFSVDPNSGAETMLHSFLGGTDGETPVSGLTYAKGVIYGTTEYGGGNNNECAGGCGAVFSITP